jgi:type IV pilus assembly protein PilW
MVDLKDRTDGFTLVELMVAMTIGLIVMSSVYSTYRTQQKSYVLQEQVAAMQQNIRAAMYYMTREIRMAGCDPTGNALAGITGAGPTTISFTRDISGPTSNAADGDTNDTDETITFTFDGTNNRVTRNAQALAENIDALDFVYLNQAGAPVDGTVATNIPNIRSVVVTVVARTGRVDLGYINNVSFTNQQGVQILAPQNDNFHRKTLTSVIKCRNLGL